MKRISREHAVFSFGLRHRPVATVKPGEEVWFETRDGNDGQIMTGLEDLDKLDTSRGNPATGPVAVEGAGPGDTLIVDILDIRLAPRGPLCSITGRGPLKDVRNKIYIVEVNDGQIHFPGGLRLPVRPMIGTIGTTPAKGEIGCWHPGPHGGNMDNIEVTIGAKLYLPVFVPGALLAMGDLHPNQGDGELMGSSIEIEGEVLVKLDLLKGRHWERPWIESPEAWFTCADAPTLLEAIRLATHDMVELLREKMNVGREEAYMLVSLIGGVRICQACEGPLNPTVRGVFPKLGHAKLRKQENP